MNILRVELGGRVRVYLLKRIGRAQIVPVHVIEVPVGQKLARIPEVVALVEANHPVTKGRGS
jgi:hypothetical protein